MPLRAHCTNFAPLSTLHPLLGPAGTWGAAWRRRTLAWREPSWVGQLQPWGFPRHPHHHHPRAPQILARSPAPISVLGDQGNPQILDASAPGIPKHPQNMLLTLTARAGPLVLAVPRVFHASCSMVDREGSKMSSVLPGPRDRPPTAPLSLLCFGLVLPSFRTMRSSGSGAPGRRGWTRGRGMQIRGRGM